MYSKIVTTYKLFLPDILTFVSQIIMYDIFAMTKDIIYIIPMQDNHSHAKFRLCDQNWVQKWRVCLWALGISWGQTRNIY